MKDLLDIRNEIDGIDRQIVELFENRMILTTQVAEYKISTGKAVFDKEREVSKLDSVAELAHSEFNSHGVRELFEHIMSVSRKRQYQLLTEHGKFAPTGFVEVKELDFTHAAAAFIPASEDAAKSYFPEECGLQKCTDWREACDVLQREEVNFAFLPMPDPASGYVSANYNLVAEYGFYILEEYETSPQPKDRYLLISKDRVTLSGADKISICFELPHESGTLYNMLSHIIYNGLNMTKIESRPIPGKSWEYRFFVDFTGKLGESAVENALRGIEAEANVLRVLGNY